MRGRNQKIAEPKIPRESLNSSTIQKYLKEVSVKSPGADMKQAGTKDKKTQMKQKVGQGEKLREDTEQEGAGAMSDMEESRNPAFSINKIEMIEMFTKLENVIKSEILNVRSDMSHLLRRWKILKKLRTPRQKSYRT